MCEVKCWKQPETYNCDSEAKAYKCLMKECDRAASKRILGFVFADEKEERIICSKIIADVRNKQTKAERSFRCPLDLSEIMCSNLDKCYENQTCETPKKERMKVNTKAYVEAYGGVVNTCCIRQTLYGSEKNNYCPDCGRKLRN